jgi:hypothetical protein
MQARATRADGITAEDVERVAEWPDTRLRELAQSLVRHLHALRGRFRTRRDGSYAFLGVRPTPYASSHDGPVGRMLDPARPPGLDGPWCSVEADIVLAAATGD